MENKKSIFVNTMGKNNGLHEEGTQCVTQQTIEDAIVDISNIQKKWKEFVKANKDKVCKEYEMLKETTKIPANIRKAEHFLSLLERTCGSFKILLIVGKHETILSSRFLELIEKDSQVNAHPLSFLTQRLDYLIKTLGPDVDYHTTYAICEFGTMISTQTVDITIIPHKEYQFKSKY